MQIKFEHDSDVVILEGGIVFKRLAIAKRVCMFCETHALCVIINTEQVQGCLTCLRNIYSHIDKP